jgi:sugar/nucleoside kinase (ribokinase family)
MKKKVICAGHICLDITPKFKSETLNDFSHIFVPGHLTEVGGAAIHTGGSVANTGLAMKLFLKDKSDVLLKGIVGDDDFGRLVLNILDNHGASDGMIVDKEASSSYTIALAVPGYDRMFFHNPGPNDTFDSSFITEDDLKSVSLFHFGYPTLMKKMYKNDGAETIKLFKKVKAAGCISSLDLTVVDTNSEAAKATGDMS